eukprot:g35254.t1
MEDRQGRGGEYVSDGISLEVAEMASDGILDVDAGGMVEVVEGEDELSQAEESGSGCRLFRLLLQEATESPETILVEVGRVKGLHVHGKEEATGACKLEILKLEIEASSVGLGPISLAAVG